MANTKKRMCKMCHQYPARKDSDYCCDACEWDARIEEGEDLLIYFDGGFQNHG